MSPGEPLEHLREHEDVIASDLALLREVAPSGVRLLDIGAGRGSFLKASVLQGIDAIGMEVTPSAAALWGRERLAGVIGDGSRAPFRAESFGVVRMKEVIEHVHDPLALVTEAARILRPGGLVLLHTPTPYSQFYPVGNFWDDYTHVRPFSRTGLRRLIADAGLELVRIDAYVSGRNALERVLGLALARVFPHIYRAVAKRP
jgi:SAM-dependent methyltransferase